MDIGNTSGSFRYCGTPREIARHMRELGYRTVDWSLTDVTAPFYESDEAMAAYAAEVKAACREAGLTVWQIHGPWPTDDTTEQRRAESMPWYRRAVYGAAQMGAGNVVIHPAMPFGWEAEQDPALTKRLTRERIEAMLEVAEPAKVCVCLENMPMSHSVSHIEGALSLVRAIGSPYCGVCLDTGHCRHQGQDPGEQIALCGADLRALHVHDTMIWQDEHLLPMTREIDWESFVTALAHSPYAGPLNLETAGNAAGKMPPEILDLGERQTALTARYLADRVEKLRQNG